MQIPSATADTQPYWDAAGRSLLAYQWCEACERSQFYPRLMCVRCGRADPAWRVSAGRGSVYAHTTAHRPASSDFAAEVPYSVAIVELDEGFRMLARVSGSDDWLAQGARVEVCFRDLPDNAQLPEFREETTT